MCNILLARILIYLNEADAKSVCGDMTAALQYVPTFYANKKIHNKNRINYWKSLVK